MSVSHSDQSVSVSNSIQTTSNPPDIEDNECIFGDSACGEPLITQRISLDFTPNDLDNDFVQRKCCAFWDFINSRPELKNIKAVHVPEVYSNESESSVVKPHFPPQEPTSSHNITKTAVDILEFVKEKGLIDRAFEARLPKSYCENNRTPSSNESMIGIIKEHHIDNYKGLKNKKDTRQSNTKAFPKLRIMCNKMKEWDMKHPKCRPICKSRRRVWKGEVQNTSAELFLERKPLQECFRRWPTKVYANSPCPLFARTRGAILKSQDPPSVVRICQAPIDDAVDTPYLKYAELAKRLGAWHAVKSRCAFCSCRKCCGCGSSDYVLSEHCDNDRRRDMKAFDTRVKHNYQEMRIMYDNY